MKAMHDVLGEVKIINASEGLTVLIEHDGQTKEVLRRSVVPLPAAELARREQACPYCDGYGAVRVGMNPASVDGMEECICQREQAQAPQPENLHQYKSALANMEQTINELRRKNARLRSLLAELIDQLVISELTEEDAERIEPLIGKAKEAIK